MLNRFGEPGLAEFDQKWSRMDRPIMELDTCMVDTGSVPKPSNTYISKRSRGPSFCIGDNSSRCSNEMILNTFKHHARGEACTVAST